MKFLIDKDSEFKNMVKEEEKKEGKEKDFIQDDVLKEKKISAEESVEDYYPSRSKPKTRY